MKNKIWITAANGMVGKAIIKRLSSIDNYEIISTNRKDLEQTSQIDVENWIKKNRPNSIIICSSMVGGIHYNDKKAADFLYNNSLIALNIIHSAQKFNCQKVVFLGASCMYPKDASQPLKEESLMTGEIEKTNLGYGLSKILGTKLIELYNKQFKTDFKCVIPAASYGPNDCFNQEKNHVIPALLMKLHNAKVNHIKEVEIWGSGNALREFIHVDDMADGIIHVLEHYKDKTEINLGSGEEISIKNLVKLMSKIINYNGKIKYNIEKPEGVKRKFLDSSKIKKLGWSPKINLEEGIKKMYEEYLK